MEAKEIDLFAGGIFAAFAAELCLLDEDGGGSRKERGFYRANRLRPSVLE